MAIFKALGSAAAIATASIAISSSCSSSSSSSASPFSAAIPKRRCHHQHHHYRHHQAGPSPRCCAISDQEHPFAAARRPSLLPLHEKPLFHNLVGRAMAVGTAVTDENASLQETIVQQHDQGRAADSTQDVVTEFMVDMKCEGCVSSVRQMLEPLAGVKKVDIDLPNQVVRVQGSANTKSLNEALAETGRKARLIGQGSPNDFLISATVAEFKGPLVYGVVRIVQVSMELARIEANFSGLLPGPHGWSINEYGDLTRGAESTGGIYHPAGSSPTTNPIGDMGVLVATSTGEAEYSGDKPMLRVADLPGRALVVYASEDKSEPGIAAAVIARSAGVGENYKKLCTCDGTVIWDSTNSDFVKV